jgi:hypothetical protein
MFVSFCVFSTQTKCGTNPVTCDMTRRWQKRRYFGRYEPLPKEDKPDSILLLLLLLLLLLSLSSITSSRIQPATFRLVA